MLFCYNLSRTKNIHKITILRADLQAGYFLAYGNQESQLTSFFFNLNEGWQLLKK